jgi:hypothetical protein
MMVNDKLKTIWKNAVVFEFKICLDWLLRQLRTVIVGSVGVWAKNWSGHVSNTSQERCRW